MESSTTLTIGGWTLEAPDLFGSAWTDQQAALPGKKFYRIDPRIPLK